jgi:imidazoleglycerol-phosphate dehydratase
LCVHLSVVAGRDPHHMAEAAFKALARALSMAVAQDPRRRGAVASTKGTLIG